MYNQDAPSTEVFIPTVISRTTCKKHQATEDEHCYPYVNGVCNARAKRAGYDHAISDKARRTRSGSTDSRRKDR